MGEIVGLGREALERARRSRDPRFDGKFFIAVVSTRIYCRTICPARAITSPVRFYKTAAEAAEAGFRPCLRCRPESAPGSPAWIGTSAAVRRALRLINEGALDSGSVENLATRVGIGARHLNRLLVEQVGASPLAIAQTRRLHFAKQLLNDTNLPVTEIALAAGYGSVRRFNAAIKTAYNRTPRDLRKRRPREADPENAILLKLSYRPPYDWNQLCTFLATRAAPGVERIDARGYARTVRTSSGYAVVQVSACSHTHAVMVSVRGAESRDLFELSSAVRRVFDLSADPMYICAAFRDDPVLGPLIARRPGLRIAGVWDPFECAVLAILEQHAGLVGARALLVKLVTECGTPLPSGGSEGLTHLFPSAEQIAAADLATFNIEPEIADSLRSLAQAVCAGLLRFDGAPEETVRLLNQLKYLGPHTAQYVALRGLGDPDACPFHDLALRRQISGNGAVSARVFEARAEVWRPWRGYAAFHLWACSDDRGRHRAKAEHRFLSKGRAVAEPGRARHSG